MKKIITISLFLFSLVGFSQEKQDLAVFETDSTWIKEIIEFPIGFAQEIKYEGFEDLRFPQGWSKEDSPNFWSYVWAWSIIDTEEVTTNDLEKNIQYYFDGLLGLDFYKIDDKPLRKTNAVFIKKNKSQFVGKVKTHDTRYTKKPMTLNVTVETSFCEQENKTIIHFRFSPKPFDNPVWDTLAEVKLKKDFCEN
ncbi:hypothetical protein [Pontimicrobium sp. SW4]|uniref:Uncharacterized protein n=1 Tax=Pontimicrobium sp. SW4 TaxID=3153519 RepID=A0AAU7BUC5_9FLAO